MHRDKATARGHALMLHKVAHGHWARRHSLLTLVPNLLPAAVEYVDNHAVVLLEAPNKRAVFQVCNPCPAPHALGEG